MSEVVVKQNKSATEQVTSEHIDIVEVGSISASVKEMLYRSFMLQIYFGWEVNLLYGIGSNRVNNKSRSNISYPNQSV